MSENYHNYAIIKYFIFLVQKTLHETRMPRKITLTRSIRFQNLAVHQRLPMALNSICLHLEVNVHYLETSNVKLVYMLTLLPFWAFITSLYIIEQIMHCGVSMISPFCLSLSLLYLSLCICINMRRLLILKASEDYIRRQLLFLQHTTSVNCCTLGPRICSNCRFFNRCAI